MKKLNSTIFVLMVLILSTMSAKVLEKITKQGNNNSTFESFIRQNKE